MNCCALPSPYRRCSPSRRLTTHATPFELSSGMILSEFLLWLERCEFKFANDDFRLLAICGRVSSEEPKVNACLFAAGLWYACSESMLLDGFTGVRIVPGGTHRALTKYVVWFPSESMRRSQQASRNLKTQNVRSVGIRLQYELRVLVVGLAPTRYFDINLAMIENGCVIPGEHPQYYLGIQIIHLAL